MNKPTLIPGTMRCTPLREVGYLSLTCCLLNLDVDPEPDPHHHHPPPHHHPSSSFISYSTASFLPFAFILHIRSLPSSSSVPLVPSLLLLCNVYHRSVWPLLPSLIQSRWISPSLHVSVAQWCCWIWLSFPHTLSDCVVQGWWTDICHYTPLLHQSWGICAFLMHPQSPAALEWTLDGLWMGHSEKWFPFCTPTYPSSHDHSGPTIPTRDAPLYWTVELMRLWVAETGVPSPGW